LVASLGLGAFITLLLVAWLKGLGSRESSLAASQAQPLNIMTPGKRLDPQETWREQMQSSSEALERKMEGKISDLKDAMLRQSEREQRDREQWQQHVAASLKQLEKQSVQTAPPAPHTW